MDKSHRFNCDMTRILTDYIKADMPEEIQTVGEPFSFWEEHMEAGVCIYVQCGVGCNACEYVFHNNNDLYTTGPGDIIALMGIAVETKLDVYCYVPLHDDAQKWSSNIVYKRMQFRVARSCERKQWYIWSYEEDTLRHWLCLQ
jgi:hypothetical protein